MKAPKPKAEKAAKPGDGQPAAYNVGDTDIEQETLTFIAAPASGLSLLPAAAAKKNSEFDLFDSIFGPRRITSDGKSFYDDEQVTRRAFEIDFARCNQERFRLLIKAEDDDTGDGTGEGEGTGSESMEIGEIKDVLCRHRDTFYSAFRYFSGLGAINERGDGFSMAVEDYETFVKGASSPTKTQQSVSLRICRRSSTRRMWRRRRWTSKRRWRRSIWTARYYALSLCSVSFGLRSQSMCMAASRLAARISPRRRLQMCRRLWSVCWRRTLRPTYRQKARSCRTCSGAGGFLHKVRT